MVRERCLPAVETVHGIHCAMVLCVIPTDGAPGKMTIVTDKAICVCGNFNCSRNRLNLFGGFGDTGCEVMGEIELECYSVSDEVLQFGALDCTTNEYMSAGEFECPTNV